MAKYAELFDGTRLEFPDDTEQSVILSTAKRLTLERRNAEGASTGEAPTKEATIGSQLAGGAKQSIEDYKTWLQTIGASKEEISRLAMESNAKQQEIAKEVGQTRGLKEVGEAYDTSGILGAAKEVASQAPGFIAGSLPQAAEMAAGAGAGALVGSVVPGVGTGIGALAGSFMALYPQFFSQNIAGQSAAMQESGVPKEIDTTKAAIAATGQAALESAGKGYAIGKNLLTSMFGKVPTEKAAKALATKELVAAAESTLKNVGSGVVRGTVEEAFVNPAQDILERWQSGKDLFSKEALRQYGESMYQGAVAGGAMGPAAGIVETKVARGQLEKQGLDRQGQPAPTTQVGTEGTTDTTGATTAPVQEKFVINEQGTLVPNPLYNAAPAETTTTVTPPPAAPIPAQAQESLFAPEELPASSATLTPDTLVANTEAGAPIETAALQAPERAQAEIERNIFALEQQEQTPQVQQQIATLKEQLTKGPGETLDILKQEHTVLANKGAAIQTLVTDLTQKRDAAPTLDAKAEITAQIKPLQAQLDTIINRQQELLQEGAKVAKGLKTTQTVEEAPALNLQGKITEDDFKTMKINKSNTKLREAILGKELSDPVQRQEVIDILNDYAGSPNRSAEMSTRIGNFVNSISQETQDARDTGAEPVSRANERSVSVLSPRIQATKGTTPSETTGVGSAVGTTTPVDGGEGVSGADGDVALEQTDENGVYNPFEVKVVPAGTPIPSTHVGIPIQTTPAQTTPAQTTPAQTTPAQTTPAQTTPAQTTPAQTTPAQTTPDAQSQAAPAPVGTQDNAQLFKAAGGKTRPSFLSRAVTSVVNTLKSWEDAYSKNQLISTQMFGKGQNLFSFDDGFNNRLRAGFMELASKGDITIPQAQDAMLRATMTQALFRSELAHKFMSMGNLSYDNLTNRWTAESDDINMGVFEDLAKAFAARTGIDVDTALDQMSKAYEANRVMEFYDSLAKTRAEITRTDKKVKELTKNKKRTKEESKDLGVKQAYLDKLKKDASDLEHKTMHMTRQQALVGMQLYNNNPEIKAGTEVFNAMRERAVSWLVKTGVKTQEQADKWLESLAYVPFQRVMDEDEALGLVVANKGIRENMTDKRMKGSMLDVDNTIGNMYQWMQWSISRAISNQQLNVMLDSYKTVAPEEVREGAGKKGNTFTVFQDGTKREYNVANPAVAQAFIGAQSLMFPGIGALRSFKTAFTHAFTRLPLFPTAQLIFKDTWEAMFTSGLKHPWMLLKQIPTEIIKSSLGTSEARKAMSSAGVLSTHDTPFLGDANDTATKLNLNNPNAYRKVMRMLDKWAALNDNMLRQAVYAQTKAEGGTHAQAMEKAVEIFNFRRQSGNVGMQIASQIVPFMNAFGQMQRITIKTLSGSGISPQTRAAGMSTLLTTSAVLGMLTFAYAASVSDDEDYQKMNRTQRDSSFVIPGTGGLRIPIRMGLLTMPKLIGEYLYHAIADKGYTDPQMFKSAMSRAVKQQFMPPIGGAIVPPIALVTNHDFFYDREIVNATQRQVAPEFQFNKNTTELAKMMGRETGISPLQLDYAFKAYLGQYATLIALSNNSIAKGRGVSRPTPENPTKEFLMNLPGVGSFMTREDANGALSDFYEAARDTNTIVESYRFLEKRNPAEADKYLEKNEDKLLFTKGISTRLGKLNTAENIILETPDTEMSPDEKAKELKDINEARREIGEPIKDLRQQLFNKK